MFKSVVGNGINLFMETTYIYKFHTSQKNRENECM